MRADRRRPAERQEPPDETTADGADGGRERPARGSSRHPVASARRAVRANVAALVALVGVAPLALSGVAGAHTDYVVSRHGGPRDAVAFLVGVLAEPSNLLLLAGGSLLAGATVALHRRSGAVERDVAVLRRALSGYRPLVPWMLRLGIGLPLVGAGVARYFVSPLVPLAALPAPPAATRLFLLGAGFALLLGAATRVVAALVLTAYAAAAGVVSADLLLASEYVGALLALVLLGGSRPSADHLLARLTRDPDTAACRLDPLCDLRERVAAALAPHRRYAVSAVRVALGVTFIHLGLANKLLAPAEALAVVSKYHLAQAIPVSPGLWVVGAGLAEVALGVALVAGLYTRATAGVAFVVLTLTLFTLPDDPVLAHVSLFALSSTLVVTGGGPLSLDRRGTSGPFGRGTAGREGRPDADV